MQEPLLEQAQAEEGQALRRTHKTHKALIFVAVTTFAAIQCAEAHCGEPDLVTPAALYSIGGAADWSASRYALRARPELREANRLGLTGGVAFTSALFMGADVVLQKKGHKGSAKWLRRAYVVGVSALVANSLVKAQQVRR